jgi:predicted DNA-binding WGR domain protein
VTNDYNDGANSLKHFLEYAEAVSAGDAATARRVLESLNPLSRQALAPLNKRDAVIEQLASALRSRGYVVEVNVGQSKFRCDLAVRNPSEPLYQLGILVDTEHHYANPNLLDRYLLQPAILRAFGWRRALVLTKDWYHNAEDVLLRLKKALDGQAESASLDPNQGEKPPPVSTPLSSATAGSTGQVPSSLARPPADLDPGRPDPSPSAANTARHFVLINDTARKFWDMTLSGKSFTVRFGRIGTSGQTQSKTFSDEAKAKLAADYLVREKLRKGYVERP